MIARATLVRACLISAILVLMALGCALLALSSFPFEAIKSRMDAFALDGTTRLLNPTAFGAMVEKVRFLALACFVVGVILLILRRQAQQHLSSILTDASSLSRQVGQRFRDAIKREDRIHLLGLAVIGVVATAIRFFYLSEPMRYDESATFLYYASRPLYLGLSFYATPNNHLLNTFLVHVSCAVFGNNLWAIRLPAFLAGISMVPAAYVAIRLFYNKSAALLAAALVACSSPFIFYSTNARGYTMVGVIFLLMLTLATYLKRSRNESAWLLFALLSALGFYATSVMLYPFGVVIVWLFLSITLEGPKGSRMPLYRNLLASVAVTVLVATVLFSPVIIASGLKSLMPGTYIESGSWSYFAKRFPSSALSVWKQWNNGIPIGLQYLLIIGFFTSLIFHRSLARQRIPLAVAGAIWLIPLVVTQRVFAFLRLWLFLLPVYFALACAGLTYFLRLAESKVGKRKPLLIATLAIALSVYLSLNVVHTRSVLRADPDAGELRDAEAITLFLKNYLQPGDRVVAVCPSDCPLEFYFRMHGVPSSYLVQRVSSSSRILVVVNHTRPQTISSILETLGFPSADLPAARTIGKYQAATLYEVILNGG